MNSIILFVSRNPALARVVLPFCCPRLSVVPVVMAGSGQPFEECPAVYWHTNQHDSNHQSLDPGWVRQQLPSTAVFALDHSLEQTIKPHTDTLNLPPPRKLFAIQCPTLGEYLDEQLQLANRNTLPSLLPQQLPFPVCPQQLTLIDLSLKYREKKPIDELWKILAIQRQMKSCWFRLEYKTSQENRHFFKFLQMRGSQTMGEKYLAVYL